MRFVENSFQASTENFYREFYRKFLWDLQQPGGFTEKSSRSSITKSSRNFTVSFSGCSTGNSFLGFLKFPSGNTLDVPPGNLQAVSAGISLAVPPPNLLGFLPGLSLAGTPSEDPSQYRLEVSQETSTGDRLFFSFWKSTWNSFNSFSGKLLADFPRKF